MKRVLYLCLVALLGCHRRTSPVTMSVTSADVPEDRGAPTRDVTTDHGVVRGVLHGETYAFRGIPYAAAPVGAHRFAPPADAPRWTSPRAARDFGACCVQAENGKAVGSEDCLTLNVWTPKQPPLTPRPVMVFVHGGGNTQGCSGQETQGQRVYEGDQLAVRGDVVVVTMNYRLGMLGFFAHPDVGGGNWAIRDQAAALEWVKRNAAAFGGDPGRVMLFGESAGAVDTCAQVVSPRSKGLFTSALMESAMCQTTPRAAAEAQNAEVAKKLGCKEDVAACLRTKPAEELVRLAGGAGLFEKGVKWTPVIDGDVLPAEPLAAISSGAHNHVSFVIGDNSAETLLWVKSEPIGDLAYRARMHEMLGKEKGDAALARYPVSAFEDAKAAFVAATTDAIFLCPARKLARAMVKSQKEPVYRYFFAHGREVRGREVGGASHAAELLFVFHHLRPGGYAPTAGEEKLSETMMDGWSALAAGRDPPLPSWPRYDGASDPYLRLDDAVAVEHGLRTENCDFWDAM